ncbi:MAG: ribosome biogenesis GTP-binding protein YihA/YsxC [Rickettsiales bacterium]|jgi:GTP-binding protein|nr:ribosome biogenesis GTP-binding protein YihA/YsxC [Rickettsiales bacterium]
MTPKFIGSFTDAGQLPKTGLPEFAFVGRSNVGKSSLINAITGFSKLARVSNTPGRTRGINMFEWDGKIIVDLPGYGFAAGGRADIRAWNETLNGYISSRRIKKVFVLVDARRGIMPIDGDAIAALDKMGIAHQIAFTKTDKVPKAELSLIGADIIKTSSAKKTGMDEILKALRL